jgi:hypothetical protein
MTAAFTADISEEGLSACNPELSPAHAATGAGTRKPCSASILSNFAGRDSYEREWGPCRQLTMVASIHHRPADCHSLFIMEGDAQRALNRKRVADRFAHLVDYIIHQKGVPSFLV